MEVHLSMSHLGVRTRYTIISTFLISVLIITVTTSYLLQISQHAHAQPVQPMFNHFLSTHYDDDGQYDDNNPGGRGVMNHARTGVIQHAPTAGPELYGRL